MFGYKKIFLDIRFWIAVFFIIRLIGITDPPLEVGHNWRQTTVTMVSRNFLETDNNILYPRVDFAGEKLGITGMEFPLLNYLIYLVAKLFGYQHWYGRLINLFISSFGLWYFYKLLRKYFAEPTAFYSTIILTVSIWFQFSRKIMPDTFSMSLIITGIYYGCSYLENKEIKYALLCLITSVFLLTLGVLSKLPSGYLLVVFLLFFLDKRVLFKRKIFFILAISTGMISVIWWYFYWVPYLVEEFGFFHFFMGKRIAEGLSEVTNNMNQTLDRFYETALQFIGFGVFLIGMYFTFRNKEKKIYIPFALCFFSFLIIVLKSGFTFFHHSYYIIPFVPVMALIAGYGLSNIKNMKIAVIILIGISVENIANQKTEFFIHENDKQILNLEKDFDKISSKNDLIIINSGFYPTPIYFAHRKGWIGENEKIKDDNYINSLKNKGLKFIVILKRSFGTPIDLPNYKKMVENEDYCIYRI